MQLNNNKSKQRRHTSNNKTSFGKNSCLVTATSSTLRSFHIPFSNNQGSFISCNTKAKNNLIKLHFRSFRSWRSYLKFKENLKKRFNKFSDKKLYLYPNLARTKVRYFCIKKTQTAGIK